MFYNKQKQKNFSKEQSDAKKSIDGIFFSSEKNNEQSSKPKRITLQKIKSPEVSGNKDKSRLSKKSLILISIFIIFALSVIPIKIIDTTYTIKAKANNTIDNLNDFYNSIKNNDLTEAKKELTLIKKNTDYIKEELNNLGQKNVFISHFIPIKDSTINNENILDFISSFSEIGLALIDNIFSFTNTNVEDINSNENNELFFKNIKDLNVNLKAKVEDFENLKESLDLIDLEKLNAYEKKYLEEISERIKDIDEYYYLMIDITEKLPSLLGKNFDKKYLLLFQNNTEIRPTGGFVGTYGILTVRDAKIKDIFIDSIYNPDGQISKNIIPPLPLQKVTSYLAMRDANWDPNFPDSAKNISNLYEIEGGFTPDGVIAFDTKPFIDLLDLVGPIKLEGYDVEMNKDNFISETQYKTSIDYNPADQNPKKFLSDFAPLLLEKTLSLKEESQKKLFEILIKNIEEKHIQFFSSDNVIENIFTVLNAGGNIKDTSGDYFAYVNANIGGMKTNGEIEEKINHKVNINTDGSIIHKVEIKRRHNGSYNWPSGINYSYIRFYLPAGSKVLEIENFEKEDSIKKDKISNMLYLQENAPKVKVSDLDVSQEHNKTVVGIWQVIKPEEEIISSITYQLPFKIDTRKSAEKYTLLIQKQAGVISQETNINLEVPSNFDIEPTLSVNGSSKRNVFSDSFDLVKDEQIGVILNK